VRRRSSTAQSLALSLPRPLAHQRLTLPDTMQQYYRARAKEYDLFYQVPERLSELNLLQAWLIERTRGLTILEIAAGTGYWTEIAAPFAQAIAATDLNAETLEIAATRRLGQHVILRTADAYSLPHSTTIFDVGMAHLWWSHVERQKCKSFLSHFASRLRPAATLLMIDQLYVEGFTSPISREDRWGNQYTIRKLRDGSTYEIVKNFPRPGELEETFKEMCKNISVLRLQHFWALSAQVRD
jgi:SAM-dependent methyltransferase